MKIKQAIDIASEQVKSEYISHTYIDSAYIIGSVVDKNENEDFPLGSDLDIMMLSNSKDFTKPGKILIDGVIIEFSVTYCEELSSINTVLSSYHVANGLKNNTIIFDKTGFLTDLQKNVEKYFYTRESIMKRRDNALEKSINGLKNTDYTANLENRLMGLIFSSGILCHVMLVSACKNPTIRKRYTAARELLNEYNMENQYKQLLELVHFYDIQIDDVMDIYKKMVEVFDSTVPYNNKSFPYSSDITNDAREIAANGTLEMINKGEYREAMFWIGATLTRCISILAVENPDLAEKYRDNLLDYCKLMKIENVDQQKQFLENLISSYNEILNTSNLIIDMYLQTIN